MHIISLVSENIKRIQVVEIIPKGRVIQVTGKNGQGKTSVLDSVWYGLVGKRALPERPVRKGAEKARIKLTLGNGTVVEYVVTRTITSDGYMTLHIENGKGTKVGRPQEILDELLGALTFDPLEFVGMKTAEQVQTLRKVVKLDIDMEAMKEADTLDFNNRREINRKVENLEVQLATITVQDGLPAEKLDEKAIMARMEAVGEQNKKAQELNTAKQNLFTELGVARNAAYQRNQAIKAQEKVIEQIRLQLAKAEHDLAELTSKLPALEKAVTKAEAAYEAAPAGEFADVNALTAELSHAQLINREIDKRTRRDQVAKDLADQRRQSEDLTRAMEGREEKRRHAVESAPMPIEGLTFNDSTVLYKGIPLDQLGEAEQIRVSVSIAMAANPTLRILRIMHGEALDDDALAILAQMAEEHDFQIWMAKVDSSGKVGIILEDGMVKSVAD